jgi:hypothetical protein
MIMNDKEYYKQCHKLLEKFSTDPAADVRVSEDVAQELLLRNNSFMIQGTVRWLQIIPLGLGVYKIGLNTEAKTTYISQAA